MLTKLHKLRTDGSATSRHEHGAQAECEWHRSMNNHFIRDNALAGLYNKTAVWRRVDGVGRFCFILYPFWIFAYGQEEGRRLNFAVFDKFKEYQEGGNE